MIAGDDLLVIDPGHQERVVWTIFERGPWAWGDAQETRATAIPATLTPLSTATARPTNTAVPVAEQGEVEIRSSERS